MIPPDGWTAAAPATTSDGWMHAHTDDGKAWVHLWGTDCDKGSGPGAVPVNRIPRPLRLCGVDIGNERICPHFKPCPTHDPVGELLEEIATTPPEPDGSVILRAPANDAGRVDFSAMLSESWQPIARDRMNAVLGRPYLSTQLTALLPADVCMRLIDRLERLIHEAVQRELDKLHDELDSVTAATPARLAAQADDKLQELRRERFGATPSHRWGG